MSETIINEKDVKKGQEDKSKEENKVGEMEAEFNKERRGPFLILLLVFTKNNDLNEAKYWLILEFPLL